MQFVFLCFTVLRKNKFLHLTVREERTQYSTVPENLQFQVGYVRTAETQHVFGPTWLTKHHKVSDTAKNSEFPAKEQGFQRWPHSAIQTHLKWVSENHVTDRFLFRNCMHFSWYIFFFLTVTQWSKVWKPENHICSLQFLSHFSGSLFWYQLQLRMRRKHQWEVTKSFSQKSLHRRVPSKKQRITNTENRRQKNHWHSFLSLFPLNMINRTSAAL